MPRETKLERIANAWWLNNRDANSQGEGVFGEQSAFECGFQMAAKRAHEIMLEGGTEYEIRKWLESLSQQDHEEK